MKFLVDEDISPCLKFILDEWGHEAQAVSLRRDLIGKGDPIVLSKAAREGRVVVTFNLVDYEELHELYRAQGRDHAGIVVCRTQAGYGSFHNLVRGMRNLLKNIPSAEFPNQIHYLHTHY